jgi:HD-like signal output (HDOD) protein
VPAGRAQQEAVTAALLHDIGELVMITDAPAQWLVLNQEARRRGLPLHAVESERDGITHGDTGAYLLSLWGLPDVIVEAVAHHHDPGAGMMFDAAVAVHVADALAHELEPAADGSTPSHSLDEALIDRLGLTPRLDLWRHLASQLTA